MRPGTRSRCSSSRPRRRAFERGRSSCEETYARMVEALPEDVPRATLLLLAAAGPGARSYLAARSRRPGSPLRLRAGRARRAGRDRPGKIGFRHPLIRRRCTRRRPAPTGAVPTTALASACVEPELEGSGWRTSGGRRDRARRGARGPVERLASDMRLRGGAIGTVEWYQRAAALSGEPGRAAPAARGGRRGAGRGRAQAAEAILGGHRASRRAGPMTSRASSFYAEGSRLGAARRGLRVSRLLDAARSLEDADPHAAAGLYIESVDPAIRAGRPQDAFDAAERALELAPAGDPMGLLARIARAASLVFLGDAAAAEADIDAVAADVARTPSVEGDLQLRAYLGMTLAFAERIESATETLDVLIDECEQSAPGALTYPLISRAWLRRTRARGRAPKPTVSEPSASPVSSAARTTSAGGSASSRDRRRPGPARRGRARASARALGPPRVAVPADVRHAVAATTPSRRAQPTRLSRSSPGPRHQARLLGQSPTPRRIRWSEPTWSRRSCGAAGATKHRRPPPRCTPRRCGRGATALAVAERAVAVAGVDADTHSPGRRSSTRARPTRSPRPERRWRGVMPSGEAEAGSSHASASRRRAPSSSGWERGSGRSRPPRPSPAGKVPSPRDGPTRRADACRARGREPRRGGQAQQGDCGRPVDEREDGRGAPVADLQEAGRAEPRRARGLRSLEPGAAG